MSAQQLKTSGVSAQQTMTSGVSAQQIMTSGVSAQQTMISGVPAQPVGSSCDLQPQATSHCHTVLTFKVKVQTKDRSPLPMY